MAEYIKLEPLREEIFNDDFDCDIINHFLNIVDSQPTADVVEVVRCKDCQHRTEAPQRIDLCEKCFQKFVNFLESEVDTE